MVKCRMGQFPLSTLSTKREREYFVSQFLAHDSVLVIDNMEMFVQG